MELTWIYICGASIIISLVFLTIYSWKKSRSLRLLGYEYVYTYMKECGGLAYYREKKRHIDTRFEENYLSLVENRNKWYLFFGTKLIIEHLIDFYEKACYLTNGGCTILFSQSLLRTLGMYEVQTCCKRLGEIDGNSGK